MLGSTSGSSPRRSLRPTSKARTSWAGGDLRWTGRYQPGRKGWAMPLASLRSRRDECSSVYCYKLGDKIPYEGRKASARVFQRKIFVQLFIWLKSRFDLERHQQTGTPDR